MVASPHPSQTEQQIPLNVADRLADIAAAMPDAIAVATPGRGDPAGQGSYRTCTFRELHHDATALARGLVELGVSPGDRIVLLVRPGVEFVKLVFALLRSGATTVLVDPGMGRKHLVDCIAAAEPNGFIGIPAAHLMRIAKRKRFPQARLNVSVGPNLLRGTLSYRRLLKQGRSTKAALPPTTAGDQAALIFTSGSTGPPKGVLYTQRMFDTQAAEIRRQYQLGPGGADLSCFALFGLFNAVMGVTTVFPEMDFAHPARAEPKKLLAAARDWQVTQAFASPAVWRKVSKYCENTGDRIPTLRSVFSCGAPVPEEVVRRTLSCVHAQAQVHTPYGATEALPVATISAREVLNETAEQTDAGAGVCVGRPFDSIEWRVIAIRDEPIRSIADAPPLAQGEIGELIVRGPQVSPSYTVPSYRSESNQKTVVDASNNPNANINDAASKIVDGEAAWHRMGDVGYLDEAGRFWYCGRKSHRVATEQGVLFTIPVEAVFNRHADVDRSALVGIGPRGRQTPVVVVQSCHELLWSASDSLRLKRRAMCAWRQLTNELRELATPYAAASQIEQFLLCSALPVDVRHNSKINREILADWASKRIG